MLEFGFRVFWGFVSFGVDDFVVYRSCGVWVGVRQNLGEFGGSGGFSCLGVNFAGFVAMWFLILFSACSVLEFGNFGIFRGL